MKYIKINENGIHIVFEKKANAIPLALDGGLR